MTIVATLDRSKISRLENLIVAGLEYGDNDYDGKMDNRKIKTEFPDLLKQIETKTKLPLRAYIDNE